MENKYRTQETSNEILKHFGKEKSKNLDKQVQNEM